MSTHVRSSMKVSRLYIDQIDYLPQLLLKDYIATIFSLSNRGNPDQAALTRVSALIEKVLKVSLCEVNG